MGAFAPAWIPLTKAAMGAGVKILDTLNHCVVMFLLFVCAREFTIGWSVA
jgi:hypothetical protein